MKLRKRLKAETSVLRLINPCMRKAPGGNDNYGGMTDLRDIGVSTRAREKRRRKGKASQPGLIEK